MRRDQKALLLATALTLVLWSVGELRWLVIPLVYLNTQLHEMCHALAAAGTGGAVNRILVYADGSGVTETLGGFGLLISSAGYVGATVIGGLVIVLARTPKSAKLTLGVLGTVLGLGMLLWLRGDVVGLVSAIAWIVACLAMAKYLTGSFAVFAAQFIGIQQCLTSAQAMLVLLKVSATTEMQSDAMNLERMSGLPAIVWASGWAALSALTLVFALRAAWKTAPSKVAATRP